MVVGKYDINPPPNFNSRFKQQKLKAWQPILTAGTVLPTFFVIGLIFIPIGAVLFITSNDVREHVFDYTDCKATNRLLIAENVDCKDVIKNKTLLDLLGFREACTCEIRININEEVAKPVFIYYGLTNFYQNHRRYVKSRSDVQLLGDFSYTVPDCQPFEKDNNTKCIYPCGAVANSMFNDTFFIQREISEVVKEVVPVSFSDIAWPSDREKKFFNPKESWAEVNEKVVKPPYWQIPISNLSQNKDETGVKNESFIVWMRTAALPTFRKLHSRIYHAPGNFSGGLPAGNYTVTIGYTYPVDSFDGLKRFIISNTSWAGGKNPFLGIAYMVVGSLCILTGFIFLLIHMKFGKSLTELASVN